MLWNLLLRIIAAIVGLFLADKFVDGVSFNGPLFILPKNEAQIHDFVGTMVFVGIFLGVLNSVVKPVLNLIALPLRIITLNLFSIVVAMVMVWLTKIIFPELEINGIVPLFWTTLIVWALGFFLVKWLPNR